MENRSHALMTGFFTIALLIGAILVGVWLNRDRIESVQYEMATKLSIPGLNPEAAVRYRGLDVGKVASISFDPKVTGQILIRLKVNPDTPITQSTYATLGYQGVTGIAYVQLNDDDSNPNKLASTSDKIGRIELRPSLLDKLESHGIAILAQTEELTKRFSALLDTANQKRMLSAFDNLSKTAAEFEAIPKQLEPTLSKLPAVADQARNTLASFNTLSNNLNALTTNLQASDGPLYKIANAVDTAGTNFGSVTGGIELESLPRVNALADETRSSMRTLNRTLKNLDDHPQSILFGSPSMRPGPGEPGFVAPAQ